VPTPPKTGQLRDPASAAPARRVAGRAGGKTSARRELLDDPVGLEHLRGRAARARLGARAGLPQVGAAAVQRTRARLQVAHALRLLRAELALRRRLRMGKHACGAGSAATACSARRGPLLVWRAGCPEFSCPMPDGHRFHAAQGTLFKASQAAPSNRCLPEV